MEPSIASYPLYRLVSPLSHMNSHSDRIYSDSFSSFMYIVLSVYMRVEKRPWDPQVRFLLDLLSYRAGRPDI